MARGEGEVHETVEQHSTVFRDLMLGFIRLHVLHHASRAPVYGSGISAELERHGYRVSWGTLYPLLHNLAAEGFLEREQQVVAGKVRKYYAITSLGRRALRDAASKAVELVCEISDPAGLAADTGAARGGPSVPPSSSAARLAGRRARHSLPDGPRRSQRPRGA
jgi:PadR family transcriptional regulator